MDYDALAKQYGGATAAPVDYDALAKQAGGSEIPASRRSWSDTFGEAVSNLPTSAGKFGREMYEYVTSPIQTATNILDLGAGALQNITPKVVKDFVNRFDTNPDASKRAVETANAAGGFYAERYGTVDGFKEALATDPVSVIGDFSALLSGGAGALTRVAPRAAKVLATTAKYTNPAAPFAAAAEYGIGMGAKAVGNLADVAQGQRPAVRAGSIVRNALTEEGRSPKNLLAAQAAIQNAAPGTTVRQALSDVTAPQVQFLGEMMDARSPGATLTAQQAAEASRLARLQSATPDLLSAEKARKAATQPLYSQADKAVVPVTPAMEKLFGQMPKGTLEHAADIARMDGRPFVMGQTTPARQVPSNVLNASGQPIMTAVPAQTATITGESLHYVKRALSDIANAAPATTGLGRDAQKAARGVLARFIPEFEGQVPVYGQARQTFAQMSAPVNQATALSALTAKLEAPMGVGERPSVFVNALGQGEQALLKKSTGFARYSELSDVLTPGQMKVVGEVKSEVLRDANIAKQTKVGVEAMKTILDANRSKFRAPGFMSVKVTLANEMLSVLEGRLNKKVMAELEKGFQSGTNFSDLMKKIPASERIEVLRVLGEVKGKLSPNKLNVYTQVQNALAPQDTSDAVIVTPQNSSLR
jgi:hypothetical protein